MCFKICIYGVKLDHIVTSEVRVNNVCLSDRDKSLAQCLERGDVTLTYQIINELPRSVKTVLKHLTF